jgi:hypothetical protein
MTWSVRPIALIVAATAVFALLWLRQTVSAMSNGRLDLQGPFLLLANCRSLSFGRRRGGFLTNN